MRIVLVIDSLDSGGAQRQICTLAILLKRKGHDVRLLMYHPHDFFKPVLEQAGVPVKFVPSKTYVSRVLAMRREIRRSRPDVAIAYLMVPSFILELAGLPFRKFGVIVSERNSCGGPLTWRDWTLLTFHRLADAVVTNSEDRKRYVQKVKPALEDRLHTIINCVDLQHFRPLPDRPPVAQPQTRLVVLARVQMQKNALGLADAMRIIQERFADKNIVVDWYGNDFFRDGKPTALSSYFLDVKERINELRIDRVFRLHPPVSDVISIYRTADAVLLPSFYEGCSNVICEALACGKPVLASNVCDNDRLVKHGANGFLFDPHDAESIAHALVRFASLSRAEKTAMGRESRLFAESELSEERFSFQFLSLIESVCSRYAKGTQTQTECAQTERKTAASCSRFDDFNEGNCAGRSRD